jgi:hypothetical protein
MSSSLKSPSRLLKLTWILSMYERDMVSLIRSNRWKIQCRKGSNLSNYTYRKLKLMKKNTRNPLNLRGLMILVMICRCPLRRWGLIIRKKLRVKRKIILTHLCDHMYLMYRLELEEEAINKGNRIPR